MPARTPIIDAGELAEVAEQADWDRVDPDSLRAEYQILANLDPATKRSRSESTD